MMGACYILSDVIGQEGEFEGNFRTEKKKQIPFLSQTLSLGRKGGGGGVGGGVGD